jgi:integrase/recombinase XerD
VVGFLATSEVRALLASPRVDTWIGRRDHALLLTMIQTGLRVSEVTHLSRRDVQLGTGAHVRCDGKGRKERCVPLAYETAAVLRAWLKDESEDPSRPLFPARTGGWLSRDAVEDLVEKYRLRATQRCSSLREKRVTPHVLRHTTAMRLLDAGIDRAVIALWLGHESTETTEIYLHADLSAKERALARTAPLHTRARRYRASDSLLAFLATL